MKKKEELQARSHSGATLNLTKNNENNFIIQKTIKNNINRNKKAIQKQIEFKTILTPAYEIRSVPVFNQQELSDGILFDMPYVEGITGEQISIYGNRLISEKLKESLNWYLFDIFQASEDKEISTKIIKDKLDSIYNAKLVPEIKTMTQQAIVDLKSSIQDKMIVPIGNCHGDLTFSNIILSNNKMYLFDFLDTFIETPLQDIGKLYQELLYCWSLRHNNSSVILKGEILYKHSIPSYIEELNLKYKDQIFIFTVLTILRISPYIIKTDYKTIHWYKKTLQKLIQK